MKNIFLSFCAKIMLCTFYFKKIVKTFLIFSKKIVHFGMIATLVPFTKLYLQTITSIIKKVRL
jgi:hypothetical protein